MKVEENTALTSPAFNRKKPGGKGPNNGGSHFRWIRNGIVSDVPAVANRIGL